MRFWNTLKNIVFRPDFFASATFTLKDGLKFYSLLLLLFIGLRILLALPNTVHLYQAVLSEQWQEQKNIIDDLYPDELKLTLKEGIVTTNVAQPYPLSLPEPWRSPKNNTPDNLLVINTDKPIETGDFESQNTIFILGRDGFGYHDPNKGEFRIYDFVAQGWKGNMELDKTTYSGFVTKTSTILQKLILVGCFVLPFILYSALWILYLIYLFFGALIVWGGAKLHGHTINYGQAYTAGLFLLPIPFLYEFLSSYGHGIAGNIPFAFSLILLLMTLINFKKSTPPEVAISSETPPPTSSPV